MAESVEITKLELLQKLRSLDRSIVLTKNKESDLSENFREDPSNKARMLDGYWPGKPKQVTEGHDYAAHFITHTKLFWLGKYSGYVNDSKDVKRNSIIIENPICYKIIDWDAPSSADHDLLTNFLKQNGAVIFSYFPRDPAMDLK